MKSLRYYLAPVIVLLLILGISTHAVAGDDVVCFGDSATAGAVDLSFPDYLEFFIDPGDGDVVNEGEGGETTDEGFWRVIWLIISLQYYDAEVWTYWEGGNDIIDWVEEIDPYLLYDPADPDYPYREELNDKLDDIKWNITASVELIRLTGAEVVLGTYLELVPYLECGPSPIGFLLPGMADKANHYLAELNEAIREVADDTGAPLNDMNLNLALIGGHLINYHDCNHLNALGNFYVAVAWWIAVLPYL